MFNESSIARDVALASLNSTLALHAMSTDVVNPQEKRSISGNDDTPEKSLKKLRTMDVKAKRFCSICDCSTDHNSLTCPKRSTALGLACSICCQPCEIKEHQGNWKFHTKLCLHCYVLQDHWTKDCPTPNDDDDDLFC